MNGTIVNPFLHVKCLEVILDNFLSSSTSINKLWMPHFLNTCHMSPLLFPLPAPPWPKQPQIFLHYQNTSLLLLNSHFTPHNLFSCLQRILWWLFFILCLWGTIKIINMSQHDLGLKYCSRFVSHHDPLRFQSSSYTDLLFNLQTKHVFSHHKALHVLLYFCILPLKTIFYQFSYHFSPQIKCCFPRRPFPDM